MAEKTESSGGETLLESSLDVAVVNVDPDAPKIKTGTVEKTSMQISYEDGKFKTQLFSVATYRNGRGEPATARGDLIIDLPEDAVKYLKRFFELHKDDVEEMAMETAFEHQNISKRIDK